MENQEILDSGLASGSDLQLNSSSKDFLKQTAKWAKFLAIISIVFSAIIVIIGLFFGKFMSAMSGMQAAATGQTMPNLYSGSVGIFMAVYYAVIGLIMLYPGVRMLQFSNNINAALSSNDTLALESGLKRLRSVFRFYGILAIISLVFMVFGVLAMLVGLSALGSMK